jgi:hypothetical protein
MMGGKVVKSPSNIPVPAVTSATLSIVQAAALQRRGPSGFFGMLAMLGMLFVRHEFLGSGLIPVFGE